MTWNIFRGKLGMDGLAAVIKAEKPDIVFLQENLRAEFAPEKRDQAADLAERLGGLHIYSLDSLHTGQVHRYGDPAILSRWPLKDLQAIDLGDGGRTYALTGTLDAAGLPMHLISVHADGTFRLELRHAVESMASRHRQISNLIERAGRLRGSVLIAGDFNTPEWMPEYRQMCEAWIDLGRPNDPSLMTLPAYRPAMRLDYVFSKGAEVTGSSYRVIDSEASDHRPVVVDIKLIAND